jgi:ribosomal-protein-alanine N-acetyltransferase
MTIRKAVPSDTARLHTLEHELFTKENFPLSRRLFYYHIQRNLLLVAETEEDHIAGYILTLIRRHDAKINSLGVSPRFRHRGIAASLLKQTMLELSSRGFARTLLEVRSDNEAAIALYLRLGFRIINQAKAFYLDGCDAYIMEIRHTEKTLQGAV